MWVQENEPTPDFTYKPYSVRFANPRVRPFREDTSRSKAYPNRPGRREM